MSNAMGEGVRRKPAPAMTKKGREALYLIRALRIQQPVAVPD